MRKFPWMSMNRPNIALLFSLEENSNMIPLWKFQQEYSILDTYHLLWEHEAVRQEWQHYAISGPL